MKTILHTIKIKKILSIHVNISHAGAAPGTTASTTPSTAAPAAGQRPGVYVPPHRQPGGAMSGPGSSLSMLQRRDDQYTIRVSNLPEDAKEQDLYDLFDHFGKIHRVFLAKDKVTRASKVSVIIIAKMFFPLNDGLP